MNSIPKNTKRSIQRYITEHCRPGKYNMPNNQKQTYVVAVAVVGVVLFLIDDDAVLDDGVLL